MGECTSFLPVSPVRPFVSSSWRLSCCLSSVACVSLCVRERESEGGGQRRGGGGGERGGGEREREGGGE